MSATGASVIVNRPDSSVALTAVAPTAWDEKKASPMMKDARNGSFVRPFHQIKNPLIGGCHAFRVYAACSNRSSAGNPAVSQRDPWLCVPASRRVCPCHIRRRYRLCV